MHAIKKFLRKSHIVTTRKSDLYKLKFEILFFENKQKKIVGMIFY